MNRHIASLLALVLITGCTGTASLVEVTSAPTTATTSTTTTTTTTTAPPRPPVEVDGAGDALRRYLETYYGYATGRSRQLPPGVPEALAPRPASHPQLPTVRGTVSVADFRGDRIAVFEAGDDLVGLVRVGDRWRIVAGRAPSIGVEPWFGEGPVLVAVVGSDARPGESVTLSRADSIHILGMDTRGGAALVGIPRDSWVPIPGHGTSKINASLSAGGPEMMMATFGELSGLDLDGYVITGFEGFERLVDDVLLPFEIDIPFTYSDRGSKADFEAGAQIVDGRDALAFSRTRKAFPTGDFQRQLNGGLVLMAALGGAKLRGPLAFPDMIAGTEQWLETDLTAAEMLRFALVADQVRIDRISNIVLHGVNATTSGGAAIVRLDESFAADTFTDLADGNLD